MALGKKEGLQDGIEGASQAQVIRINIKMMLTSSLRRVFSSTALRHFSVAIPAASDHVVFPREGPGLSYSLNWTLAKHYVTPIHAAILNSASSAP